LNRDITWQRFLIYLIVVVAVELLIFLLDISPITCSSDCTKQLAEISKIVGLLISVEGVLLGLSPILFDKLGKGLWGVLSVTITAVALIWSLLTIVVVDTAMTIDSTVRTNYWLSVGWFGVVIVFYVVSVWETWEGQRPSKMTNLV